MQLKSRPQLNFWLKKDDEKYQLFSCWQKLIDMLEILKFIDSNLFLTSLKKYIHNFIKLSRHESTARGGTRNYEGKETIVFFLFHVQAKFWLTRNMSIVHLPTCYG